MYYFKVELYTCQRISNKKASLVAQRVKHLPAMWETGVQFPELGRSSGGGNGNLLQYSCLENPMGRESWCRHSPCVTKSWTQLSDFTLTFTFSNKNSIYIIVNITVLFLKVILNIFYRLFLPKFITIQCTKICWRPHIMEWLIYWYTMIACPL